eukprot:CAMPEP_0184337366 /NCGR_PEP_ID=MMETSP1089-20130417/5753_1 /TAXON_ID=38269 ORGANISM="Gloeochaete wittrockiana, Strain SAG46.84" /NCGR_SAMPLE_ID=MMETSP1089 /ASSEMBLY_ACC=CAM_ASM_000445 /LENGTH=2275 /DNA_ID=CAMNT_0026663035 /DNA_START=186 /DNA_END=7013 /DNA_ORIENTATION=-
MTGMRSFLLAVLLVVALAASGDARRTLHVDYVYPSEQSTTVINVFTSDIIRADRIDVGTFKFDPIVPADGVIKVNTTGPVALDGSFVNISPLRDLNVTSSSFKTVSSENLVLKSASEVNINPNQNFSVSTIGQGIKLFATSSLSVRADQQFIKSKGPVEFVSTAGPIDILSDDTFSISSIDTIVNGENRLSIFGFHTFQIDAQNNFNAHSDLIDFDSDQAIRLTASTGNLNLKAGNSLFVTSRGIATSSQGAIDIASTDSEIRFSSFGDFSLSGAVVAVEGSDEVLLKSTNADVAVTTNKLNFDFGQSLEVKSQDLSITSKQFTLAGQRIFFDSFGKITFNVAVGAPTSAVTNDLSAVLFGISSNQIVTDSNNLLFTTEKGDILFDSDIGGGSLLDSVISFQTANYDYSLNSGSKTELAAGGINYVIGGAFNSLSGSLVVDAVGSDEQTLSVRAANNIAFNSFGDFTVNSFLTQYSSGSGNLFSASGNIRASSGTGAEDDFYVKTVGTQKFVSVAGSIALLARDADYTVSGTSTFTASTDITFGSATKNLLFDTTFSSFALSSIAGTNHVFSSTGFVDLNFGEDLFQSVSNSANINAKRDVNIDIFGTTTFDLNKDVTFISSDIGFLSQTTFSINNKAATSLTGSLYVNSDGVGAGINFVTQNALSLTTKDLSFATHQYGDLYFKSTNLGDYSVTQNFDFWGANTLFQSTSSGVTLTSPAILFRSDNELPINVEGGFVTYTLKNGPNFAVSNGDLSILASDVIEVTANQPNLAVDGITVRGDSTVHYTTFTSTKFVANKDIRVSSDRDASYHADVNVGFTAGTTQTFSAGKSLQVNGGGDISFNAGSTLFISSPANSFNATGTINILASNSVDSDIGGTFGTAGGDIEVKSGRDIQYKSRERTNFIGYTYVEIDGESVDFKADSTPGSAIRFIAQDQTSESSGPVTFDGGDISFHAGVSRHLITEAQTGIVFKTAQAGSFFVKSNDEVNITADYLLVNAFGSFSLNSTGTVEKVGIHISTTDANGNILFITRNGYMNVTAVKDIDFTAANATIFAANDVVIRALDRIGGGLLLNSDDYSFDEKLGLPYGELYRVSNVADHSEGIVLQSLFGEFFIGSGADLNIQALEDKLLFTADTNISYLSSTGDFDIDALHGKLTVVAKKGDISFLSNNGDFELNSYGGFTTVANKNIDLISHDESQIGIEFSTEHGNIFTIAQSIKDIDFVSKDDSIIISSGLRTNITSEDSVTFTASTGSISTQTETGANYYIRNGNFTFQALKDLTLTSSQDNNIDVNSGNSASWIAESGFFSAVASDNAEFRTTGGNVLLQTNTIGDTNTISLLSSGTIRIKADASDNSPVNGDDTDGISIQSITSDIQFKSLKDTTFDSEGIVTFGVVTKPTVQILAGGDAGTEGAVITSFGNILLKTNYDFDVTSSDDFYSVAQNTLDLKTTASISIVSTGTSPEGKDVHFQTIDGDMQVNAKSTEIEGTDAVTVTSFEYLEIKSTADQIDFRSATTFTVDTNRTVDIDAANWSLLAQEFDFFAMGDVSFKTATGSAGSIFVNADNELLFESDVHLDFFTKGANANIDVSTTTINDKITIQTTPSNSRNSDINVLAIKNDLTFVAGGQTLSISGNDFVKLFALDVSDTDNIENGNILYSSQNDLGITAGNRFLVDAGTGLNITASNPNGASLTAKADGFVTIEADSSARFISAAKDLLLSQDDSNYVTQIGTFPRSGGNVEFDSKRVLDFKAGTDMNWASFGDFVSTASKTVQYLATEHIKIGVNGTDASLDLKSLKGQVLFSSTDTGDNVAYLINGNNGFWTATGTATLKSDRGSILISDDSSLSHQRIVASQGSVTVTAPDGISIDSFSGSTSDNLNTFIYAARGGDLTIAASQAATVSAPQRDIRVLDTVNDVSYTYTGDMSISSRGINTVQLFEGRGESSNIDVTSDTISNSNCETFTVSSFNPEGGFVDFQSDPDSISISSSSNGHLGFGIEFTAHHPNADVVFYSSDFLLGSFNFASSNMLLEGYDSVTVETVDDDDTAAEGEFTIRATNGDLNYNGRRVHVHTTEDGDIFFTTHGSDPTSRILVTASDSVNVFAKQQSAFIGSSGVAINSRSQTTFHSGRDTTISSPAGITITGSSAIVASLGGDLNIVSSSSVTNLIGLSTESTPGVTTTASDLVEDVSYDFFAQSSAIFSANQIVIQSRVGANPDPAFQPFDVSSSTHLLIPFRFRRLAGNPVVLQGVNCPVSDEIAFSPIDSALCYCATTWRCLPMA